MVLEEEGIAPPGNRCVSWACAASWPDTLVGPVYPSRGGGKKLESWR